MKSDEEIMEILEAFDLTGSYRDTTELAGCSPHTVARYVEARDEGRLSCAPARRDQLIDPYLVELEEWVETSHAKVRVEVVHDKLRALGYEGSERTTRRVVAVANRSPSSRPRQAPWSRSFAARATGSGIPTPSPRTAPTSGWRTWRASRLPSSQLRDHSQDRERPPMGGAAWAALIAPG
ncbi:MAG: hypothetical protein WAV54_17315 [Acidimicrobiales bacterium]